MVSGWPPETYKAIHACKIIRKKKKACRALSSPLCEGNLILFASCFLLGFVFLLQDGSIKGNHPKGMVQTDTMLRWKKAWESPTACFSISVTVTSSLGHAREAQVWASVVAWLFRGFFTSCSLSFLICEMG